MDEAVKITATTELPDSLPRPGRDGVSLEQRIVQGVKGSFFISVVTLPFGYLLSLILARVSPEAVGTYSVLGIYLGVVSTLLYFGGGTVSIRFMAELPQKKRVPFFLSYFTLTLAFAAVVVLSFFAFPSLARLLLGAKGDHRLFQFLVIASPIPLLYFEALASLRGLMRVTLAQALMRSVTLLSCLFYGYLLLFRLHVFQQGYTKLIVGSYFLLMLLAAAVGFGAIWKQTDSASPRFAWFLPAGFWSFALAVQVPSMLALMQMKIDEILLLFALGLSQLGIYFVFSQLAGAADLLTSFFLEGVFPAILNLQAAGKVEKTTELHQKTTKYVLLISAGTVFFLIAFAEPILRFLGTRYLANYPSLLLLLCFASLDCLGPVNHTLIVGFKKMKSWTVVQSVRLVGFVAFFALFARSNGLLGVVLARGLAWILAGAIGYWIALTRLPVSLRIPRQYFLHVILSLGLVSLCYLGRGVLSGWVWSGVLFSLTLGVFLTLGGYRPTEFQYLRSFWRGVKK